MPDAEAGGALDSASRGDLPWAHPERGRPFIAVLACVVGPTRSHASPDHDHSEPQAKRGEGSQTDGPPP